MKYLKEVVIWTWLVGLTMGVVSLMIRMDGVWEAIARVSENTSELLDLIETNLAIMAQHDRILDANERTLNSILEMLGNQDFIIQGILNHLGF